MARAIKQGIPYYSLDTDVFSNRKIRRLLKNFGSNGYLVYSYVLTEIYRDKGYFIVWDEDTAFDVSDYLNLKETLVSEVIKYCCVVGLFNKELLTSEGILSSKNIQSFWLPVVKKANRTIKTIEPKYDLIPEESTLTKEESTPNNEVCTPTEEESTQSKVKESKVNKIKEEKDKKESSRFSPPSISEVKNYFFEKTNNKEFSEIQGENFYSYYDSQNWMRGKNRIKKWKSAVTGWVNRQKEFEKEKKSVKKEKNEPTINRQTAETIQSNAQGWDIITN